MFTGLQTVHKSQGSQFDHIGLVLAARESPGRLVLVTVNARDVGLMNGDVGVIVPDGTLGGLAGLFPAADGRANSPVRRVAASRLPPHDGALVMTVHKSQGSQFDHVGLVLAGRESPIETRELVYTGITRARARLTWLGGAGELARRCVAASSAPAGSPSVCAPKRPQP